jgi:hypothetical protein
MGHNLPPALQKQSQEIGPQDLTQPVPIGPCPR